jgi:diaminopimelate epimerase
MAPLRFAKMAGAANDFIVIDDRSGALGGITRDFIARVCRRRYAVGADGLMLLSQAADADFAMRYFNADGSDAGMCGNGGRCIARFAVLLGIGREGQELTFTSPAGRYQAVVQGGRVRLNLPPPSGIELAIALKLRSGDRTADFIHTGVPHAVFFTDRLEQEDVPGLGREIRRHPRFQPAGTNVNFCQVVDEHHLRLRTYERGVEGETLGCGTGAAAAAMLAAKHGRVRSPVGVVTASGETLDMEFTLQGDGFANVRQSGEARLIYWGELSEEATKYARPEK